MSELTTTLTGIGIGAASGVVWSVIGYIKKKSANTKKTNFELKGLAKAIATGVVVGGYAGYQGVSFEEIDQATTLIAGLVPITAVTEKVFGVIYNVLGGIKSRFS